MVIYFQKNDEKVVRKVIKLDKSEICITQITRAELFYGVFKSEKLEANLNIQKLFLQNIQVILPSFESDQIFGAIKALSRKTGKVVSDADLLIASICLANNLTLVTANTKDFTHTPKLKIENWAE